MGERMMQLPFGEFAPAPDRAQVYTVSELNAIAKELLERGLPPLWVEGEISNLKHHSSGHMYFTLKDEGAALDAVMFAEMNARLPFAPEDGQKVLAFGHVTIYERRGRYQIEVHQMRAAGLGKLQREFERLKAQLQAEGLFDEGHKQPIASYPQRLALVTSPEGAALRDMLRIIAQRCPGVDVLLFPARVQGEGAAEELAEALGLANRYDREREPIDTLILARGGGSLEDLWAFNEEILARAIFASKVPIITGVGHEIDFTIADFVADVRAPTPTAAAQLAVPDRRELLRRVAERVQSMTRAQLSRLEAALARWQVATRSYGLRKPLRLLREHQQTLDQQVDLLIKGMRARLQQGHARADGLSARLESLNPIAILRRGYAVVQTAVGQLVVSSKQVKIGERIRVRLSRGRLECDVVDSKEEP